MYCLLDCLLSFRHPPLRQVVEGAGCAAACRHRQACIQPPYTCIHVISMYVFVFVLFGLGGTRVVSGEGVMNCLLYFLLYCLLPHRRSHQGIYSNPGGKICRKLIKLCNDTYFQKRPPGEADPMGELGLTWGEGRGGKFRPPHPPPWFPPKPKPSRPGPGAFNPGQACVPRCSWGTASC